MNRKVKAGLTAFIVLSLVALTLLVVLHYRIRGKVKVTINEERDIEVRIEKVHYSGTKEGRLEWELIAEAATRARQGGIASFETVRFIYHTKEGEKVTLSAPRGTYNEDTGVIDASGGVRIESDRGYTLKSPTMRYTLKSRRMTTDDPVDITSSGMDVKGIGLVVELDRGSLRLNKNIEAVLKEAAI